MPLTGQSNRYRDRGDSSSPKRSESSTAIGRAPSAKMSRRMPPTPVAAPWNGSTALGWLCDSTLNATAQPPPTSTAPAFSPGPITTAGPSVGSVRRSFLECLYAQCSLHSSENIASSTSLGSRPPSSSQTSSYSRSVRPSASACSSPGTACVAASGMDGPTHPSHRLEDRQPVGRRAAQLVDRVLGVRHEPEHVAGLVAHARDVVLRAVRVLAGRVAQHDLLRVHVAEVAAGRVLDRDRQPLAARARERGVAVHDVEVDLAADEAQRRVGQQRARQQAGLAEDLEAVADAEHQAAVARELGHRVHDRPEPPQWPDAQVVAVREAARDDDGVDALEVRVAVPELDRLADLGRGEPRVGVVAGAGKGDDAELHAPAPAGAAAPSTIS